MEAEELFNQLGFKKSNEREEWIWYKNNHTLKGVIFKLDEKQYTVYYDAEEIPTATNVLISMGLHKAISKQIEELNWY